MINTLLTKLYNNYTIIYIYIYTQYFPKLFYIKYYNIICILHEQLTNTRLILEVHGIVKLRENMRGRLKRIFLLFWWLILN